MPDDEVIEDEAPEVRATIRLTPTFISTPTGEIDASELESIPPRTFRNAWRLDGPVLVVDMEAAREIHKRRLRAARAEQFLKIDADRAVAVENDDKVSLKEIKARAQELRDVTRHPSLLGAQTPAELDQFWPEYLGPKTT